MMTLGAWGRRDALAIGVACVLATAGCDATAVAADFGPSAPVVTLNAGLEAIRRAGRATPFAQRAATLAPVIDQSFNLADVLRAVVGPRYVGLPADQKAILLAAFADYTVANYVANFDSDSGERFVVEPQTRPVAADQVVTTRIVPPTGTPTRLDFQVRKGEAGWRIVDVLINGSISQVAVQRSDFRSLLSAHSADRLITSLRQKTASLAAGGKS